MDFSWRHPAVEEQDNAVTLPGIDVALLPFETLYASALGTV
jgi:hypothetical protein